MDRIISPKVCPNSKGRKRRSLQGPLLSPLSYTSRTTLSSTKHNFIVMEENNGMTKKTLPFVPNCISPLIPIFLESLKIVFLDNPKLFFIIYVTMVLPCSMLITSVSISSTPRRLKAYMMHLEWLSRVVPLLQGTKNVWETSQDELRKLYHFRALQAIPILVFSLVTMVSTVTTTSLACSRKNEKLAVNSNKCPTIRAISTALRDVTVKGIYPLLACVVNSFVLIMWGHAYPILSNIVGYPCSVVVAVVGVVMEVYVMAVLSLALVVSVKEERVGLDLMLVGSNIMKGRRVCGWILSGLILLSSNFIGREIVSVIDVQGLGINGNYANWMMEMKVIYMIGLVLLLGWIILWSNVVFTVFYCDLRKRNVNRESMEKYVDGDHVEIL